MGGWRCETGACVRREGGRKGEREGRKEGEREEKEKKNIAVKERVT